jgi:hypothetical protein
MMYVYDYLIGHLVVAAYNLFYGDIQASYGRFERLSKYIGLLVITLPASVVAMAIVDKLSDRKGTPIRKILTVGCWQLVTMLVLATSYEFGFPYMINQLGWRLFGPPTEIYSFQNLVLHRISDCHRGLPAAGARLPLPSNRPCTNERDANAILAARASDPGCNCLRSSRKTIPELSRRSIPGRDWRRIRDA